MMAASGMSRIVLAFSVLMCMIVSSSYAQTCSKYSFSRNRVFKSCNDLPVLNSFIHYSYDSSSGKLQIAYRQTGVSSSQWVAWAINPTGLGMVGSQALVAYREADGKIKAYKSPITQYKTALEEGDLAFDVSDLTATYSNNEMIIFATLGLQNATTTLNQVWQEGPLSGNAPTMHSITGPNVQSMGSLDLVSGQAGTSAGGQGNSKLRKRNIHGVLNTVTWGLLMPIGIIIARYLKVFKSAGPAWFYLHVSCQFCAYVVGVAGWATGIKLGSESAGVVLTAHRTLGIVIFCLGTLQAFALLLRPKPDHKYRIYWNFYHHSVGYATVTLSVINIYRGFNILNPDNKWKQAYTGCLIVLGCVAGVLEIFTWFVVSKKKKSGNGDKMSPAINGSNGYSDRQGV